jgi:hypothetical protein
MQGFNVINGYSFNDPNNSISQDVGEYAYKRSIAIPADYSGKRIFLRFDGVYTYARVWVNGTYVRDHHGAFTTWNCDITSLVTPGQTAWITVGVTDAIADEYLENMTNYARHSLLGIIRSVTLVAVPANFATRLHVRTTFDALYANATLRVSTGMSFNGGTCATVNLSLKDPQGSAVALSPGSISLSSTQTEAAVAIPVTSPVKWDAEHPNLYELSADVVVGGATVETITKKFGFRQVERIGTDLCVNGKPIKLRGVCMHEVHPLLSRATTPELDAQAIRMFHDANINYLRMSHYPRASAFYDTCDKYGMYVEDDAPVVHDANDDAQLDSVSYSMNTFTEQVECNISHPSIILWEVGNESVAGTHIPKMYAYISLEDSTRYVVWPSWDSYPPASTIPDTHYPQYNGNFTTPWCNLYNEYAHINNYDITVVKYDPDVRNYWGESIKRFWEAMYPSAGCAGGAIWSGIDDVFLYSINPLPALNGDQGQGGEWGIIDGWRRAKPELYLVQKAFSPIRISDSPLQPPASGSALSIPVKNWFSHANLSEVTVTWTVGTSTGTISNLDVAPGASGTLTVPGRNWQIGDIVNLTFVRGGALIDEFNLPVGNLKKSFPPVTGPAPTVTSDASSITVAGSNFSIVFSKTTGKMTNATYKGSTLITGGPDLNFTSDVLSAWTLTSISSSTNANQAVISISGKYDTVQAAFTVKIDGQGLIRTCYTVTKPPAPNNGNAARGTAYGYDEVGVSYVLPQQIDRITWDRNALWSKYPDDHIGRNSGTANKTGPGKAGTYRTQPTWPWSQDEYTYYYFGASDPGTRGSNDFRSTKENVNFYSAILAGSNNRVRVESDGSEHVRSEITTGSQIKLNINNYFGHPGEAWGNYCPFSPVASGYSDSISMRLIDNDSFSTSIQSINLALCNAATASSTIEQGSWGIAKVNDGSTDPNDVGWSSTGYQDNANHTEWVAIELCSTSPVNQVVLWPRRDAGNEGLSFPVNFTIDVSTDNTNWTAVVTKTNYPNPAGNPQTFNFTDVNARYVRVRATVLGTNNGWYQFQLNELQVFYVQATNTAMLPQVKVGQASIRVSSDRGNVRIDYRLPAGQRMQSLRIYDCAGRCVFMRTVTEQSGRLKLTGLAANGTYILQAKTDRTTLCSRFFLK